MAFVYRYIDLEAQEVVYIGKVAGEKDVYIDPLKRRHEQHTREKWYQENSDNLVMQFIEVKSHADADILETWLISKYGTGQLLNKAKTGWGESTLDLFPMLHGRWRTYQRGCNQNNECTHEAAENLYKVTEGLSFHVDSALGLFCSAIKEIVSEKRKAERLSSFDAQEDFIRVQPKESDDGA